MPFLPALVALALSNTTSAGPLARAQEDEGPGRKSALHGFEVYAGLQASVWAESPELYNPTAIDVDARGRLWVTEAVNYRKWDGRNPGRAHAGGDRVVILEDTNGDGLCDVSRVFVQDPDLVAPLGIAVMGARVVVSCSPHLFVYTDTDGDDRADERQVLLTGFGGFDHDHGLHSFVAGPDGSWYGAAGNAGPHIVSDAQGWTLRSGSFYAGGGPLTVDNRPGLKSDDGRAWTGGLVLALDANVHGPPGSGRATNLRVLAHNFRNNYEVALDSFGSLFLSDNDDDGNQSCRTTWVMEGGDYGFFSADGTRSWQADRRPGQSTQAAHWHQQDPGVAPAGTINGAGGPTGVAVYEATLPGMLPGLDGAVLNADAGAGVVYAHLPRREGAGIHLEQTRLIARPPQAGQGNEGARWFRPSDVAVSTDGSIFVADWYDPGVGGHMAGDREAYGRILHLAPIGATPGPTRVLLETAAEQVAALGNPAVNVRGEALRRIARLTEMPDLSPLLGARSPRLRARGTFAHALFATDIARAQDPHPEVRIATLRAMRAHWARSSQEVAPAQPGWLELARKLSNDPSAAVRGEVALSLRDVPLAASGALLLSIGRAYPLGDRAYLEAFGIGATGKEEALYDELVGGTAALEWSAVQADLAWRLHPASAAAALRTRAMAAELEAPSRKRAIDALAFIPSVEAGEAMLDVAVAGPEVGPVDGRELARWWVEHRDTNDWRAFGLAAQLEHGGLAEAERVFASGILRADAPRTVEIDVELGKAQVLWLVARDGGDGNSCDWADWIRPRFVGEGMEIPLVELEWRSAQAAWGRVHRNANCIGEPLRIGDQAFDEGLGTHAHSEIAFEIPAGATRFQSLAGPDFGGPDMGGTAQGGTSLEFEVYLETPRDRAELLGWRATLSDPDAVQAASMEAIDGLAADAEGGLMLIRLASEGKLDEDARAHCGEVIFANPDLSVRALASEWFQRPGYGASSLPPVATLLAMDADPARGQAVFLSDRAQCTRCHTLQGRGGAIGPDLTAIGEKLDAAGLFDSILNPSAGIAHGYDTWLIETASGTLHSGFVLADGEDVILKDTQGKRRVIPRDEIAGRYQQRLSTMPEGVALGLSSQELVDLVAFLRENPTRPPVFGDTLDLFDGESLAGWTHFSDAPQAAIEDVWSVEDGSLLCSGNPIGYLRTEAEYTNFELSLEWRFDPAAGPGNSGVLLRKTGPDVVWPRSIEAQLQHLHAGDIWNIGEFPMQTADDRLQGRRTTKRGLSNEKPLGEWNRYSITLDRGNLTLEVNGEIQNSATWCEEIPGTICLQSEGAAIQFRNIQLRPILP